MSLAFGAVLKKELLTSLRSPRAFGGLFAFLVVLIGLVWLRWPREGVSELEMRARLARAIFEAIRDTALVLVAFLAPAASAGAITIEREADALEMLLVTPLRAGTILAEKLVSAVAFILIVLAATLPVATSTALLGGVDAAEVARAYGVIAAASVGFAACGVAVSTFSFRTFGAIFASYVIVMPAALGILVALRACVDAASTQALLLQVSAGSLAALLVTMSAGARALSKPPPPPPPPADDELVEDQAVLALVRGRFPDMLIVPTSLGDWLSDRTNPVYEKEVRFEVFGKGTRLVRGMIVVGLFGMLIGILVSVLLSSSVEGGGGPVLALCGAFFLMLIAPPFAASAIAGERERRTLDLVLTTTLTPREIVLGKIAGCLRTPAVLAALLCVYAPFTLLHGESIGGLVREAIVTIAALLFATTMAVAWSALLGTTLRALIASYTTIVAFSLGPLLLAGPIVRALGPTTARLALSLSTFGAVLDASGDPGARYVLARAASPEVALAIGGAASSASVPLFAIHAALAIGGALALAWFMTARFDRVVVRR